MGRLDIVIFPGPWIVFYCRSEATIMEGKLKLLYARSSPGTPLTSKDLSDLGISADLAVHYVRAGWLNRLARGVFSRPGEALSLYPALRVLERSIKGLHVGGKSALCRAELDAAFVRFYLDKTARLVPATVSLRFSPKEDLHRRRYCVVLRRAF